MGTKIKLTETQLKNIVTQIVNEAVPVPAETKGDVDNELAKKLGDIWGKTKVPNTPKDITPLILQIKSGKQYNNISNLIPKTPYGYMLKGGITNILNKKFDYKDYVLLNQIMDHFYKNNIGITGEPIALNQGGKINYNWYYPRPGTFKTGSPFDVKTGKPKSGGTTTPSTPASSTPSKTVSDKQKNLVDNGYKLPGKNNGIDGIEGYWTKRAQTIFDKQGKNGAVQFNKEIETARAKRTQKTTPPATTPKTPTTGAPVGAPSDKPGEGESLTRPAMPPQ